MSLFEDIIKRMMLACGVEKSTELADFLGKNQSTISRWRSREKVPDGAIAQIAAMTDVNYEWLKTGEGEMRPSAGTIPAETNEPELVRACDVEWSAGHKPSEPLKLTQQEVMNLRLVQTALGHKDVATTQIYTHVSVDRLKAAVRKNVDYTSHKKKRK